MRNNFKGSAFILKKKKKKGINKIICATQNLHIAISTDAGNRIIVTHFPKAPKNKKKSVQHTYIFILEFGV